MHSDIAPESAIPRRIVGFHQDEERYWVADLECGHTQHVRHDPPWQTRPWVTTEAGRASFIGRELACVECARSKT
ncbi:MAG TPA: DUF3565 domain-containing protein [Gemmatimonadaceae bacterium]|nr:DUF3565 domain-containing protein [Gemmatimonadaceae bacterium]